ncbi:MAG: O-antigen ligase family protein [Adhaeribacter sp.]
MNPFAYKSASQKSLLLLPLALLGAAGLGWLTTKVGIALPGLLAVLPFGIAAVVYLFYNLRVSMIALLAYGFLLFFMMRRVPGVPFSYLFEGLMALTWLGILFHRTLVVDWSLVKNDLVYLALAWFAISLLQLLNPYGAALAGFVAEIRTTSLNWLLVMPLVFILFNKRSDLDLFLYIILGFSLFAAFWGIKQLHIGLDSADQRFLDEGAAVTHVLLGKLRVFSIYSDAGQFGASQAQFCLVALILALGPFKPWKKAVLAGVAMILLYGMLISGTRGAMFVLLPGIFVALFLSKKTKILLVGGLLAGTAFCGLKYTSIGAGNYHIHRLRTSVNPEDESLNLRFHNQRILANYLKDYPFGGGLGIIGYNGHKYNEHKFLASVEPDSYWVKIWAMYGIVGFVTWIGFMLYILGKCGGIVWAIRDEGLRYKLLALTSGASGILLCSYGNEVINVCPSAIVVFFSWAFVFMGPRFDQQLKTQAHA